MYNILADSWYTDTMKIVRSVANTKRGVEEYSDEVIDENVPCHIYSNSKGAFNPTETSGNIQENNMLGCDIEVDIKAGDELFIQRHGMNTIERYIAGKPIDKVEPFADIAGGLTHKELSITLKERT